MNTPFARLRSAADSSCLRRERERCARRSDCRWAGDLFLLPRRRPGPVYLLSPGSPWALLVVEAEGVRGVAGDFFP